jgi:hypothetical protein
MATVEPSITPSSTILIAQTNYDGRVASHPAQRRDGEDDDPEEDIVEFAEFMIHTRYVHLKLIAR